MPAANRTRYGDRHRFIRAESSAQRKRARRDAALKRYVTTGLSDTRGPITFGAGGRDTASARRTSVDTV